jgi:Flp pilus assembly protein TadG
VETAVVILLFLLLMFSIFEYGRMVMVQHLIINAAREGCRYAVVHSTDPTIVAAVQGVALQRMGNQTGQLSGLTIQVYPSNNPGAANNTTAINNLQPDDDVTVRITGQFRTMFPTLLFLPLQFQMRSSCIMTCEGN